MSHWIHVAGNIRFDTLNFPYKKEDIEKEIKTIKNILGKIPFGSEGSLDVKILDIEPSDEYGGSCARWSINIVGDLRDVKDFSQIEEWVKGIKERCSKNGMWIRQGVIQASDDIYPKEGSQVWELLNIHKE